MARARWRGGPGGAQHCARTALTVALVLLMQMGGVGSSGTVGSVGGGAEGAGDPDGVAEAEPDAEYCWHAPATPVTLIDGQHSPTSAG